jgi:alkylresorcinol/alkylpyrone synthase
MARIVAAQAAFPPHYYRQSEIGNALCDLWQKQGVRFDRPQVDHFFDAVGVHMRHLALPLDGYFSKIGFAQRNAAWLEVALGLGERALRQLFDAAGLKASEIELFVSTTVTGIAVPSLDARLMNRLDFSASTRRLPLFGLGCVAGAAGVARISDYLRGNRNHAAILLSVELCSLTLQGRDASLANMVAAALFGDGAAAVALVGDEHPLARAEAGPRVLASRSVFFRDTERVMGWDVVDDGFRVVLGKGVPVMAREQLPQALRQFLNEHDLDPSQIAVWIAHPGGPAVINAVEESLGLPSEALEPSRRALSTAGNLSSASVLMILSETLSRPAPPPGSYGVMMAMGPGFCAELVLLRW